MRPASLAGSLAACLGASHLQVGAAAAQHYLYPGQARVWEDGLGGHVIRALPVLDAGLALNLRVICNPSIFYNGKSEDPLAFATLVGCVNASSPHSTLETSRWLSLTDWVDEAAVSMLPRVKVRYCDLPGMVERYAREASTVFEVTITGGLPGKWGTFGGLWLRRQFNVVRQVRAQLAAKRAAVAGDSGDAAIGSGESATDLIVDGETFWKGVPRGNRVLVHYRTGMWSLMPLRRFPFATHYEQAAHILKLLERREVITRLGEIGTTQRLVFLGALIEDEQAVARTKHETNLLAEQYPGISAQLIREPETSRQSAAIAHDLDLMATADYLVAGVGQWGNLGAMLQDEGVHIYAEDQMLSASFWNSRVLSPPKLEISERSQADRPFSKKALLELCERDPRIKQLEDVPEQKMTRSIEEVRAFQEKQIKMIRDRPYRGPQLPGEQSQQSSAEL